MWDRLLLKSEIKVDECKQDKTTELSLDLIIKLDEFHT